MIVLHAGYVVGSFLLWGEVPEEANVPPTRRGGRRSTPPRPQPLPYDAGVIALSAFPKEAGLGFRVTKRSIETTIAWLPMATGKPVASVHDMPGPVTRFRAGHIFISRQLN